MRAVRFAAALDYQMDTATWTALRAEVPSITDISIERVRDEFVRILLHRTRLRGFDLLDASGLLRMILPEMEALKGCSQPPEFHPEGDVWTHTRLMLSLLPEEVSLPLVLSVLLHDSGKPATRTLDPAEGRIRFNGHDRVGATMAESILTRLKFPNQIISAVVTAVANHMKFMHVQEMRPAKVRRWLAEPSFADELELHRVDCLGSNGLLDNWEFMRTKLTEAAETRTLPPWLVSGRDLLAAGYTSGPRMANVLRDVHDAQLDGLVNSKDEAMAWVLTRHPR
jgi:poly(A) polymerase